MRLVVRVTCTAYVRRTTAVDVPTRNKVDLPSMELCFRQRPLTASRKLHDHGCWWCRSFFFGNAKRKTINAHLLTLTLMLDEAAAWLWSKKGESQCAFFLLEKCEYSSRSELQTCLCFRSFLVKCKWRHSNVITSKWRHSIFIVKCKWRHSNVINASDAIRNTFGNVINF
jgi:hypothetical protein